MKKVEKKFHSSVVFNPEEYSGTLKSSKRPFAFFVNYKNLFLISHQKKLHSMDKSADTSFYLNQVQNYIFPNAQYQNIKSLCFRSLKASPTAEIYNLLGMTLLFSNEFSKSVKTLQKLIILDPKLTEPRINLAKAFFELEKDSEAIKALKDLLKISPSSYDLHKDLINALIGCHRLEKLQEIYKETVKDLPPDTNIANLYSTAADVLYDKDMLPHAAECFEKVVEIFPENERFHFRYGELLQEQGLYEEALKEFEKTVELDPTCSEAWNWIAKMKKKIWESPNRFKACF